MVGAGGQRTIRSRQVDAQHFCHPQAALAPTFRLCTPTFSGLRNATRPHKLISTEPLTLSPTQPTPSLRPNPPALPHNAAPNTTCPYRCLCSSPDTVLISSSADNQCVVGKKKPKMGAPATRAPRPLVRVPTHHLTLYSALSASLRTSSLLSQCPAPRPANTIPRACGEALV